MRQNFQNRAARILKIGFFSSFLLVEFFGLGLLPQSLAAGCSITVFWRDQNNNDFSSQPTTAAVGQSYHAVATYNNCQGVSPTINLSAPGSFFNPTGTSTIGLGGNITQATEERNAVINFSTTGSYSFSASGLVTSGSNFTSGRSVTIQVSANTPFQNTPTSNTGQGNNNPGTVSGNPGTAPTDQTKTNSTAPCTDPNSCLYNPLPEEDLTHAFLIILQGFLAIVGVWAVIFIVVGGFQMVMASGNEEMYAKAKKTITWAVLGLAIALLSFSIVAIVQNLLQANVKQVNTTQNGK